MIIIINDKYRFGGRRFCCVEILILSVNRLFLQKKYAKCVCACVPEMNLKWDSVTNTEKLVGLCEFNENL